MTDTVDFAYEMASLTHGACIKLTSKCPKPTWAEHRRQTQKTIAQSKDKKMDVNRTPKVSKGRGRSRSKTPRG